MKKYVVAAIALLMTIIQVSASSADKYSQEYLQSKNHFSITRPIVEMFVERGIKSALKKETGAKFDVKFDGYTNASIKKGIFKNIEISGNNVKVSNLVLPYVHLKSITDYNYIDYKKEPIEFKSDMTYHYDLILDEEIINQALDDKGYKSVISNINRIANPLLTVKDVNVRLVKNKMFMDVTYNFSLISLKDKSFTVSCDFKAENGVIKTKHLKFEGSHSNISLDKIAGLVNLMNPLEFTLKLLDSKDCKGNIENVNIVDNKVKVDGKIFVKGD